MELYHYTECGLDNVFIEGMCVPEDDHGEPVYCIRNVTGLHKVIAHGIVNHRSAMAGNELRFLRTEIGLTQAEMAQLVHCDAQTVGRWERGETVMPPPSEALIRKHVIEKLELDSLDTMEEITRKCVPSAEVEMININGSDPKNYKIAA